MSIEDREHILDIESNLCFQVSKIRAVGAMIAELNGVDRPRQRPFGNLFNHHVAGLGYILEDIADQIEELYYPKEQRDKFDKELA